MSRAKGNQGHRGTRAKNGVESYYKGKYYISFYKDEGDDESFFAGFNNVIEICKYLKWERTTTNINMIHQALYKALYERDEPYTYLLNGIKLKVYLIDMTEEIKENERREKFMKQFVKINSTINIEVYPDLDAIDTTNPNAAMADRLSVKPNWVYPILIRTGIHFYPCEVKNWKSVRCLEKDKVLSISEEVDDVPEDEKKICTEMKKKMARILARTMGKKESKPEPKTKPETTAA